MNKIRQFYKKNTLLIKILSSYFIIGFIILSAFSYIIIETYSKKSLEEVNKTSENMIYQSYYTADILLTNTYYNFYQLFFYGIDEDITSMLYANRLDQFKAYDVLTKLNQNININPLLRSIYIYNSKTDIVLYKVAMESGGAMSIEDFFDKDIINMLDNPDSFKTDTYFTRKVNYILSEREVSENLTTLFFANATTNGKVESAIIVNLNQDVLQQMVTNGNLSDQYQIFIIQNDGEVITHSDKSIINQNLGGYHYIRNILDAKDKKGYFTDKVNGKDSLVTYIKADRLRWIFVGVGEYSKLLSTAYSMQKTILILTVIFIFMGLLIAAFFASSIYKPFHRLLKDIQKRYMFQKKDQSLDVYDYLKFTFNELADDVDKYKIDSYQLLNTKKNEMLEKIISDEIDYGTNGTKYLEEYGIHFNNAFFVVVVLKIDSFEKNVTESWSNDAKLLKFAILNISCELFSDKFKTEGIDNGTDFVSIILNAEDRRKLEFDAIADKIREIQDSIETYLTCTVTIGVGEIVQEFDNVGYSFQTALTATKYRIVFGRKSITKYTDIKARNAEFHEYPYDMEKKIIESLKQLSIRKLNTGLNDFFYNIEVYSAYEIQMSITQLLIMLSNNISSLLKVNEEFNEYNFKVMNAKVEAYEILAEIKDYLYSLCSDVIEAMYSDPKNNKKVMAVNTAKEYIHKHLNEYNLSTDTISAYVNLSRNYIRSIFKEITEMSISEYITQCRMEEAQKLLCETEFTVKNIAESVGFHDNKYFYVIFKKYFGKTPEDYRNEKKA